MSEQTSEQSNIVEFPELKFPPIEYGVTEAALAELAERYKDPDASTDDGYEYCKDGCRELTALRTAVETRRKDLKAPALNWGRDVDKQAKDIVRRVKAIESPVREEKERIDEIKQAEARKAAEVEQARVDGIQDNIEKIAATAREQNPNDTAADYQQHITWLTELAITDEMFGEFVEEANTARDAALFKLTQWHDAALGREETDRRHAAEQARIDREKEELEAAQEKQREAEAKLEKKAREAEERKAADQKTATEKAEREEKDKQATEQRRITAIEGRLNELAEFGEYATDATAIQHAISSLEKRELKTADFAEHLARANQLKTIRLNALNGLLKDVEADEERRRKDDEARLPDKDKLARWCDAIASIPEPEVLNDKAQKLLQRHACNLLKFADRLRSDIAKL